MAILPALLTAASTALKLGSFGMSVSRAIKGAKQQKKARQALENFQRQELKNITEGLRVSTLGAELQTQEAQRRFATSVEALRSGGVRGLVGGLQQQEAQQQQLQQQIDADLDQQQMAIDKMKAIDEVRIRELQEARDAFDYQELVGKQLMGRQDYMAGLTSAFSQAGEFISSLQEEGEPKPKDLTTYEQQYGKFPGDTSAGSGQIRSDYQKMMDRMQNPWGKFGSGLGASRDLSALKSLAKTQGYYGG